jgi:hypothetical protein
VSARIGAHESDGVEIVSHHRVIAKNGAMRGYRWGVDRKTRLLDLERNAS